MTIDDVITILNSKDCMLATAGMCLMRYKERDCWKCILKEYSKTVYNKAIDDFSKWLENKKYLMKEIQVHDFCYTHYDELKANCVTTEYFAEQLKAGGKNE